MEITLAYHFAHHALFRYFMCWHFHWCLSTNFTWQLFRIYLNYSKQENRNEPYEFSRKHDQQSIKELSLFSVSRRWIMAEILDLLERSRADMPPKKWEPYEVFEWRISCIFIKCNDIKWFRLNSVCSTAIWPCARLWMSFFYLLFC